MSHQHRSKNPKQAFNLFLLLAVLFFGGMYLGMYMAARLVPGSHWAQLVGFMMLPLCLGVGMLVWYWVATLAILSLVGRSAWQARKQKEFDKEAFRVQLKQALEARGWQVPPGSWLFIPLSVGICFISAFLCAFSPKALSVSKVFLAYTSTGFCYGLILYKLARSGHLPIPEDVG